MKNLKQKTLFANLGVIAFALLIGAYMLFQVFSNLSQRIITADATLVRAEDKITTSGVFIRSEKPVYGENTGLVAFLAADGEKVSKNEDVARFFPNEQSLEIFRQTQDLQKQIDSAEYAISHLSDSADSVKLDTLIKMHMIKMEDKLDRGQVAQADEFSSKLDALIVQRSVAGVSDDAYNKMLEDLRAQKKELLAQIGGTSRGVSAEMSGYFISSYDGGEEIFSLDAIDSLTAAQIKQAGELEATEQTNTMGKIVDAYEWYFAAAISEEDATSLKKNATATLRFPQLAAEDIEADIYKIKQDETGEYIAIFKSSEMNPALLGTRTQPVEIVKKSYSGIKVPKDALQQKDGEWGVYCLIGARPVFKPAEIIYQTESYYIVADNVAPGALAIYDKMVVRAKNIENIKVVS